MNVKAWTSAFIPVVAAALACAAVDLRARAQEPAGGQTLEQPGVTPAEIQRMFDAYALVQAQEQLKLGDDKYTPFLARFKQLQDVRRRSHAEHAKAIQELRRLANDGSSDDNQIRERLKALQDIDARTEADIRKAYEGVDSVLDVRQQARFRLFEEQMERRKLELLMRARQANRLKSKL